VQIPSISSDNQQQFCTKKKPEATSGLSMKGSQELITHVCQSCVFVVSGEGYGQGDLSIDIICTTFSLGKMFLQTTSIM
jgi:hypothetical protein